MVALPRIIVKRWPQAGIDVSPLLSSLRPLPSSVLAGPCNICEWMPDAKALQRSDATWPRWAVPSCPVSRSAPVRFCMHTA